MKISEQLLIVEQQLLKYNHLITQAKQEILDAEVTKYPVFIATRQEVELGIRIIDHLTTTSEWSIYASSLEEFVAKSVIDPEKVEKFKETYKSTDAYNCYFIISNLGTQFAYLPQ